MAGYCHKEEKILKDVHFLSYKEKILEEFEDYIDWLQETSEEQHERLKTYLLNRDKYERVDPKSERRNTVLRGVNEIMERIQTRMEEQDPRFRGTLVPMGSANNHTKIGDSDESDYIYELNVNCLLQGRGTYKRYKDFGKIFAEIDGEPDLEIVAKSKKPYDNLYDSLTNTPPKEEFLLNLMKIEDIFRAILIKALSELQLPPGWRHGGFNKPNFSGLHRQGPSYVLQFDYLGTSDQVPLCMSIDFVPMIRIPIPTDADISKLNIFLIKETEMKYCWVAVDLDFSGLFYGHAEELFLTKFGVDSVPKTVIRISKALRIYFHINSPKFPSEDYVKQVLDVMKHTKSGGKDTDILHKGCFLIGKSSRLIDTPGVEKNVTYSDLGETIGDECMVKSYYIKQVLLMMMCVDESHGRGWTDDDIPDLVMTVFRLIKDLIPPYSYPFSYITLIEMKVSVSLDTLGETTRKDSASPHVDVECKKTLEKTSLKRLMSLPTEERLTNVECKYTLETTSPKLSVPPDTEEGFKDGKCNAIFEMINPKLPLPHHTEKSPKDVEYKETFKATSPKREERSKECKETMETTSPKRLMSLPSAEQLTIVERKCTLKTTYPSMPLPPDIDERLTDRECNHTLEMTNLKLPTSHQDSEEMPTDAEFNDTIQMTIPTLLMSRHTEERSKYLECKETMETTSQTCLVSLPSEERLTIVGRKCALETTYPSMSLPPDINERLADRECNQTLEMTNLKLPLPHHTEKSPTDVECKETFKTTSPKRSISTHTEELSKKFDCDQTLEMTNLKLPPSQQGREEMPTDVEFKQILQMTFPTRLMKNLTPKGPSDFKRIWRLERFRVDRLTSLNTPKRSTRVECKIAKNYEKTLREIKEGNIKFKIPVRYIESRLSTIFQLFKSVCMDEKTAAIVFYKHRDLRTGDDYPCVTKEEFQNMLVKLEKMDVLSESETDKHNDAKTDTQIETDLNINIEKCGCSVDTHIDTGTKY